ncbi:SHOCT domain-containing protein [Salmonella enterica subsp. enterica]|nr:SHOCT domain-containing protein [Paenibacillus timonensis]EBK2060112.1 SHOCT domain-containing protein [Salmonella enterica subsp. enterica serovar Typhi]ECH9276472.1 SHOCT domain-containing protein [Salmonella enterica subsp. enterica]EDW6383922.1 SHOCT domain-containing protein [Salmonella enterica subsp. enterica]
MGIWLLILIIAVGATIYVVTRLLIRKYRVEDGPLKIVKERYAKGEINDEEFIHKRELLNNQGRNIK